MKDSFMFFRNMRDIIKSVPRELQLDLREAIEDYVFDGKEPTDWAFKAIIQSIKPSLEYVGRGAPKGNQNAKKDGIEEIEEVENNSKQIKQKNQLSGIDLIKTKKQEAKAETKEETKVLNNIPSNEGVKNEKFFFDPKPLNSVFEKYGLPKVLKLTDQRRIKLKQRIRDVGSYENFVREVEKALAESSFLRGDNSRGWSADFDFFLQASSWQKVLEGKYADKQQNDEAAFFAEVEKRLSEFSE